MATLIGLHNPHSNDPDDALAPWPHRASGWRLFCMFSEVSGRTADDYMAGFYRYNLATTVLQLKRKSLTQRARRLLNDLPSGPVVLLGRQVRDAFEPFLGHLPTEPLDWVDISGRTWYYVPHPSGLTRAYNDPDMRTRVGQLLTKLYEAQT